MGESGSTSGSPTLNTPLLGRSSGFTLRAVSLGLIIGTIICPANIYFGLQAGQITGFPLAIAFLAKRVCPSLSIAENVVTVVVGGTVAAIPVVIGLFGVIPAMEFLVSAEGQAPLSMDLFSLDFWALGVSLLGPFLAIRLSDGTVTSGSGSEKFFPAAKATVEVILASHRRENSAVTMYGTALGGGDVEATSDRSGHDCDLSTPSKVEPRAGTMSFVASAITSGVWTLVAVGFPVLHYLPLFGETASQNWLWNVDVSPGLAGLGMIAEPRVAYDMALGAIAGWGAVSWIVKEWGWAPGEIGDWESGVRGWILWPSLAALLASCLVEILWPTVVAMTGRKAPSSDEPEAGAGVAARAQAARLARGPSSQTINVGLLATTFLCIGFTRFSVGGIMQWYYIPFAVVLAVPISCMAIQAVAQTGFNPVSALGKICQFLFAFIASERLTPNALLVNLIAGGVVEAVAVQAADLTSDLKIGEMLGVCFTDLLKSQLIGAIWGSFVAPFFYKRMTSHFTDGMTTAAMKGNGTLQLPLPMPAAHMWLAAAKLALGHRLSEKAMAVSICTFVVFVVIGVLKMERPEPLWVKWLPRGASFAIGMYNVPAVTIAWVSGALTRQICSKFGGNEKSIMLGASGLMMGEGLTQLGLLFFNWKGRFG